MVGTSHVGRMISHQWKTIRKERISTPDVELKHLQTVCKTLVPGDSRFYTNAHERPRPVRARFEPYYTHVFDGLYSRYIHSLHLSKRHPCEAAMRFACVNGVAEILVAQMNRGYAKDGLIFAGDPRQTQDHTFPLIEAAPWPELLRLLMERGCDVNAVDDRGRTALGYALEAYRLEKTRQAPSESVLRNAQDSMQMLLKAGATRGALSSVPKVQKLTRGLARERWARVRRLAHSVAVAAQAWKEILTHIQYMPMGSKYMEEVRANWDMHCETERRQRECEYSTAHNFTVADATTNAP